jgi:hypothetical protein
LEPLGIVAKPEEDFGGGFWSVGLVHNGHTNKAPERFVKLNGVVLRQCHSFLTPFPPAK